MATRVGGSCEWLVDEIADAKLFHRDRLTRLLEEFFEASSLTDAQSFSQFLVERGCLTGYQARRVVEGNARKLTMGLYRLVELLGAGDLGPIYQARGISDHQPYLLKVLPRREQWNIRLVRQQIETFASLPPHPGVIPFIDVGTAHGYHYLVWPYAEGRSLETVIRESGPLLPGEVARIGRKVAELLSVCHTKNLVHGLIKPSNILFGEKGKIQLLDFGIGALLADNTDRDSELVDTVSRAEVVARMLECAAPESVADSSKWTPLGDQYSLGCSLYFAASGRYPFPGGSCIDKVIGHQRQKPTPVTTLNPDVPPPLAQIIDRLMSKSPLERYRRWEELIEAVSRLANRSPCPVPVSVDVQTPPPRQRLSIGELTSPEPAVITLPRRSGSSIWKSLSPWQARTEPLMLTILGPGVLVAGQSFVLHAYLHEVRDKDRLLTQANQLANPPQWLAELELVGIYEKGDWIGFRWLVQGASVAEENQDLEWSGHMEMRRVVVSPQGSCHGEALLCQLFVGTEQEWAGELEFEAPYESR